MSRIMGADAQSPLYLGKGDYNFAALFTSVLQLCFAGFVAVLLYSWAREPRRIRARVVQSAPVPQQPRAPTVSAPVPSPANPPPISLDAPPAAPVEPVKPVDAAPSSPPSKPVKPKKQKEVYYNIVGEPIESDDE
jgi:hypothetical protein